MIPGTILPIFIDIDGTLTNRPNTGGAVLPERLARIRELVDMGHEIIIWSTGGTKYAQNFVRVHNINGVVCIGKPRLMVDDNPKIRAGALQRCSPDKFFRKKAA